MPEKRIQSEPAAHGFSSWMRKNSRKRFRQIQPYLVGRRLLDIGAAEGWVAEDAAKETGMEAQLLDVVDLNRTSLPLRLYDGRTIPHPESSFDTVTLLLTLHHCTDPGRVLAEASRVARRRVIVTESVYQTRLGRRFLTFMDRTFNRVRSDDTMPEALHFKTTATWRRVFERNGLRLESEKWLSSGLHKQRLFVLEPV